MMATYAPAASTAKAMLTSEMAFGVTPRRASHADIAAAHFVWRVFSGRRAPMSSAPDVVPVVMLVPFSGAAESTRTSNNLCLRGTAATMPAMPVDGETNVVRVNVPGSPYDVHVGAGLLARAGAIMRGLSRATKVGVVTDANVQPLHAAALLSSLKGAGFEPVLA